MFRPLISGIVILSILVASFVIISGSSSSQLVQKAFAQNNTGNNNNTNNLTNTVGNMMVNKTTANADTLMTKIRNMDNITSNSSSNTNMINATSASDVTIGNKGG